MLHHIVILLDICDTVIADDLICKVVKSLPQEIEVARKHKQDFVLVM